MELLAAHPFTVQSYSEPYLPNLFGVACPTVGRRSQSINQQSIINQPSANQPSSISARNSNPPV
eukprot:7176411-Prymnesium_polylepis.1